MMLNNFHAEDKSIEDILFSHYIFRVPRYQRPFSWGLDKIENFWRDLSEESSCFLGSFILNLEFKAEHGYIEIIDGQQRMLTSTILIAVLRDTASEVGDNDLAQRIHNLAIFIASRNGEKKYRIKCGDSLDEFFQKYIQDETFYEFPLKLTNEQSLVRDAYHFFRNEISNNISKYDKVKEKSDYIQTIWNKLSEQKAIWIEISNDEDAYTIFETVNARGEALSAADLLKNLIFKNVPKTSEVDIAKKKWTTIEDNISEIDDDVTRFIRYYWLSKQNFVTEKQLYKEMKKNISNYDTLLNELVTESNNYFLLLDGERKDWSDRSEIKGNNKIFSSILGLRYMNVRQPNVLFMSLIRNSPKINVDLSKFFEKIEKFHFKYSAICKLQANKVERLYSSVAIAIEKIVSSSQPKHIINNVQRELSKLSDELDRLTPSYQEFESKFMNVGYKNSETSRNLIRYILSKINYLDTSGENLIDFNVVNIEHFLPQNPNRSEWGLIRKDVIEYVHKIGNLTLVHEKINSTAQNNNPKQKCTDLIKSDIKITQELIKFVKNNKYIWNEDCIIERQKNFANIAYHKAW